MVVEVISGLFIVRIEMIFGDLRSWLGGVEVGTHLHGLTVEQASIEIAVALRVRFIEARARESYLESLTVNGVLPLRGPPGEVAAAITSMIFLGVTEEEIHAVVGSDLRRGSLVPTSSSGGA